MFDTTNPYTLRTDESEGITRYYISFADGEGIQRETEVSRPVYLEFLRFIRMERNLRRWDERHTDSSDLTDDALYDRALDKPKSVEEIVFDSLRNEKLRLAIQCLPEIQRRRFVLYHEFGLTYEQIAEMEGCSHVAVLKSVNKAHDAIKNIFKKGVTI